VINIKIQSFTYPIWFESTNCTYIMNECFELRLFENEVEKHFQKIFHTNEDHRIFLHQQQILGIWWFYWCKKDNKDQFYAAKVMDLVDFGNIYSMFLILVGIWSMMKWFVLKIFIIRIRFNHYILIQLIEENGGKVIKLIFMLLIYIWKIIIKNHVE
jgi:hypothetical protein